MSFSKSVLAVGLSALSSGAFAGECPADKILKTPQKIESVTDGSKLTAEVVNSVDPSGWRAIKGLRLPTRRLTADPQPRGSPGDHLHHLR
jgi:hypothetical protein